MKKYDPLSAVKYKSPKIIHDIEKNKVSDFYGKNKLTFDELKVRLTQPTWKTLKKSLIEGTQLDVESADEIAKEIKEWAINQGVTHYSHWFQPLTGLTAEKHDSFYMPDNNGKVITNFSHKDLLRGEPDASSFPSGGVRSTFEARGYTAWDASSPVFVIENENGKYLCIPTMFESWKGQALDHKIPLIRSNYEIEKQAKRVLKFFDVKTRKICITSGAEQEYFLIDESFFYRRIDLLLTGKTLFGAKSPRGHELSDHYFGTIPDRVLSFMYELEHELYKLGIPIQTRHNEVAPGQYELAPLFEESNLAADHQQLVMMMLKRVARRYGLVCLLHEKPFAGVNGSGKHLNWSMMTDNGLNLLDPGDNPHDNLQFLFFFTAVILGVYRHQDLLRVSTASLGNDYRLGGNEAPPSIISVYLGDQLENLVEQITTGEKLKDAKSKEVISYVSSILPFLPRHTSDRNRTSPFAFTGNKFEFRALGSNQSISFPLTVLNTIFAESLDDMCTQVEEQCKTLYQVDIANLNKSKEIRKLCLDVIHKSLKEARPIIYNHDGYSLEWIKEAEKRKLLNLPTAVDAYPKLLKSKNINLFKKYNVLSDAELRLRYNILRGQYMASVSIEIETMLDMVDTIFIPNALLYLKQLDGCSQNLFNTFNQVIEKLKTSIDQCYTSKENLGKAYYKMSSMEKEKRMEYVKNTLLPLTKKLRSHVDAIEKQVHNQMWDIPRYQEMLFIK